ncbi:ABC transporter substrate-binding protein [Chitinimonas lacunae]|uniref:ABC transporter substrate-binding protein n=1 Tax=Chitinimonas lacunae TaxID=1963018 RepID=A0ABV8MMP4_9NEIS
MRLVAVWLAACSLTAQAAPALVYCADAEPDGFDSARSDLAATHRAAALPLYDRLFDLDAQGRPIAGLASAWTVSTDGRRYLLTLRRGVKFHRTAWFAPSRDFNADDVVWSLNRQLDPAHPGAKVAPAGFPGAISGAWTQLIRKVEKVADDRVSIELHRPYAPLPVLLASWQTSIVSAEYGARLAAAGRDAELAQWPVGTGPYQLERYERGATIRYRAHPDYFKGRAAIERLLFAIVPDPAVRVQKLRRGECQLVDGLKPLDQAAIKTDARLRLLSYRPQITSFLAFNTTRKPFEDARVRRALSIVIDRRALIAAVFEGAADSGLGPYSGKTLWGAGTSAAPAADLATARKLLAEAGFQDGFATAIWVRQGGGTSNLNPKLSAESIQADWARLGIRTEVVVMDGAELSRRTRQGEHAVVISGWMNSLDPDELYANLLSCEAARSSATRWCDPAFDKLLDQARADSDPARREQRYREAETRFIAESPWATLAYPYAVLAHRVELSGVTPSPAAPFRFERLRWK